MMEILCDDNRFKDLSFFLFLLLFVCLFKITQRPECMRDHVSSISRKI